MGEDLLQKEILLRNLREEFEREKQETFPKYDPVPLVGEVGRLILYGASIIAGVLIWLAIMGAFISSQQHEYAFLVLLAMPICPLALLGATWKSVRILNDYHIEKTYARAIDRYLERMEDREKRIQALSDEIEDRYREMGM